MTGSRTRPAKARSALAEAIHETAAGLHRIGLLDSKPLPSGMSWAGCHAKRTGG